MAHELDLSKGYTYKKNDGHIMVFDYDPLCLNLCGAKGRTDKGMEVRIVFGDTAAKRQKLLKELQDSIGKMLETNAVDLAKEQAQAEKEQAYAEELGELLMAQQKERAQILAEHIGDAHDKEYEAVKQQLKKKYGLE